MSRRAPVRGKLTCGFALAFCVACTSGTASESTGTPAPESPTAAVAASSDAPPTQEVEPAPLRTEFATFGFALHVPAEDERDLVEPMRAAIEAAFPGAPISEIPDEDGPRPAFMVTQIRMADDEKVDARTLAFTDAGLTENQREWLPGSDRFVVVAGFSDPNDRSAYRTLARVTAEVAERFDAVIFDADSTQYFSAASWREGRGAWTEGAPDIRNHVTVHAYRDGEGLRLVSLGMAKFGRPDLVFEGVPAAMQRGIGNLLNVVAQTLVEAEAPTMQLSLDLEAIQHTGFATAHRQDLGEGASLTVDVRLTRVPPQPGDAENVLARVEFPGFEGSPAEVYAQAVAQFWGEDPDPVGVLDFHTELEPAIQAARAQLKDLAPSFAEGIPDMTVLKVKGGFATTDGSREWMWIEVTRFEGDTLGGVLLNSPRHVPGLRQGATVDVKLEEIFDFMWEKADGTVVGGAVEKRAMKLYGG